MAKNPEKQRNAARKHYEKNKAKMKQKAFDNNKIAKARNLAFVRDYLKEHPCVVCGEPDWEVLEFDHIDPTTKKSTISRLCVSSVSINTIKQEIEKCQVLCANCHRRRTRNQWVSGKFNGL